MNKLSVIQLQALDYLLKECCDDEALDDLRIVIKYDSKFVSGDFLLPLQEGAIPMTHFLPYPENSFKERLFKPLYFRNIYAEVRDYPDIKNNSIDYIPVLAELFISKIKSEVFSEDTTRPRPVIYNAVFLESGLRLPFLQLDVGAEYEFVSIIDVKSLES